MQPYPAIFKESPTSMTAKLKISCFLLYWTDIPHDRALQEHVKCNGSGAALYIAALYMDLDSTGSFHQYLLSPAEPPPPMYVRVPCPP